MSYKLKDGKTVTIKGKSLNGDCRAFVKEVIANREGKTANIVFKIYWGSKDFELENNNENVSTKLVDEVETDLFTQYFDTPATEEEAGLSPISFMKKRAYDFINDNQQKIGSFNFTDWESDEQ